MLRQDEPSRSKRRGPGENDQMSTPTQAKAQDWLTDAAQTLATTLGDWTSKEADVTVVAKSFRDDASLRGDLPSSGVAYTVGAKTEAGEGTGLIFVGPEAAALVAESLGAPPGDGGGLSGEGRQALESGLEPMGAAMTQIFAAMGAEPDGEPRFAHLNASTWSEDGGDPVPSGELFGAELEWRLGDRSANGVLLLMPAALARMSLDMETKSASATPATLLGPLMMLGLSPESRRNVERAAGEHGVRDAEDLGDLVRSFPKSEIGGAVVEIKVGQEFLLPNLRALKAFPDCAAKPLVVILHDTSPVSIVRAARLGLFGLLPTGFKAPDLQGRVQEELGN